MKSLKILAIISSLFLVNLCCAEQEAATAVAPIKEIAVDGLNFTQLAQEESRVGNLAEHVQGANQLLGNSDVIRGGKNKLILYPDSEGLVYVNGELCHVGNYPQSIIYTVMAGPRYGLQTTTDYNGIVLYVNYEYKVKYTSAGVILRHRYSDSKVVTGSNQVIIFN